MLLRSPSSLTDPPSIAKLRRSFAVVATSSRRPLDLVWTVAQDAVKYFLGDRYEVGMGNPGAVEPVAGLAKFVIANLSQRNLVYLRVSTAWDEGGHSAYGVGTSPVAGLDQEIRVSTHKGARTS